MARGSDLAAGVLVGRTDEYRCRVGFVGELSINSSSSESASAATTFLGVPPGGAGKMTEGVALACARGKGGAEDVWALAGDCDGDRREVVERFDSGGVLRPPTRRGACASPLQSLPLVEAARTVTSAETVGSSGIDALGVSAFVEAERLRTEDGGSGDGVARNRGLISIMSSNECRAFLAAGLVPPTPRAGMVGDVRARGATGGGVGVGVAC